MWGSAKNVVVDVALFVQQRALCDTRDLNATQQTQQPAGH